MILRTSFMLLKVAFKHTHNQVQLIDDYSS